jgi:hypothetical protein
MLKGKALGRKLRLSYHAESSANRKPKNRKIIEAVK